MELKSIIFIFLGTMQGLYTRDWDLGGHFRILLTTISLLIITTYLIIIRGVLKYIIYEMDLSITLFISFSICHIYFDALVLVTYTFRIFVSWRINAVIII